MVDGEASLNIIALWDSSPSDDVIDIMPLKNAKAIINSEYGVQIYYTD